jgi:SAM-dependent methyltransferase
MTLGEATLLRLSRAPGSGDYVTETRTQADPLVLLVRNFPGFADAIRGRRVVDFGCGGGGQSAALAAAGARFVLGVDDNPGMLAAARERAVEQGVADRVEFAASLDGEHAAGFDLVVAQNSMEHFLDPASALRAMRDSLAPGGRIFMTFGPPWYAPYGSHMHFFTRLPWVHLLFSEATVMRVRSRFRDDDLRTYRDAGLNKMSVRRFERLVAESGMRMVFRKYDCVRQLGFLARIPLLRELFINHVSCVLAK